MFENIKKLLLVRVEVPFIYAYFFGVATIFWLLNLNCTSELGWSLSYVSCQTVSEQSSLFCAALSPLMAFILNNAVRVCSFICICQLVRESINCITQLSCLLRVVLKFTCISQLSSCVYQLNV